MFLPDDFFSLIDFSHKELWRQGEPVWSALYELQNYLRNQKKGRIEVDLPPSVHLDRPGEISIGKGTIVEPGVYIQGPCIIGQNCVIRHGAYIREDVICGDGCSIGHCAEIKHSILLNHAFATHFAYVGDSILGNWVNLGAGVKCANLRLDRKNVKIYFENEKVETGLKKFGAVLGDKVQVGCNCVLNPGTLVGKGSICHPLLNLKGTIAAYSEVSDSGTRPIGVKILEQIIGK